MRLLRALLFASGVAGVAYTAVALRRVIAFGHRSPRRGGSGGVDSAVTILKPLCGDDPELYENLCSFCRQNFPSYQVIFGVRDDHDPAAAIARRVVEEFPDCDVSLIADSRVRGRNYKVANLMNMIERCKHDVVVIADSDMRVDPEYLNAIVAAFADPNVGAVTCLYRGEPSLAHAAADGYVAHLGSMFINEHFIPSVLVSAGMEPIKFCLGATMAVRRTVLDAIGGFEALANHLADDHLLGQLVSARGYRVLLSSYVVENMVSEKRIAELWRHELRWARTIRTARPLGYAGSFVTYTLPISLLYALLGGNKRLALALVTTAAALRLALHFAARSALKVRSPDRVWLIPIRDVLSLVTWAASFFGDRVSWRGSELSVDRAGRLSRLD